MFNFSLMGGYFSGAWKDSASLKIGIPSNEDLEGVAIEIQDGWMKLGRYFGLKRSILCNINEEEKCPSEKCIATSPQVLDK